MTVMRNNGETPIRSFKRSEQQKKVFVGLVAAALVVLLVLHASVFFFALRLTKVLWEGKNSLTANREYDTFTSEDENEYVYNRDVISILLIGVDNKSKRTDTLTTEQADALYLFSFDTVKKQIYVIAISRNTLMDIDVFDMNHKFIKKAERQVCTAFAYGRTGKESAELTVKAVSRFFYNIPISGYYAIYTDAVAEIVDSVGGVPVQIDEDMTIISSDWYKDANVVLRGDKAVKYLRYRSEGNQPRLERQKSFLKTFLSLASEKSNKDLSLPLNIYQQIASKTVTNVDAKSVTYLASEAVRSGFRLTSLKGKVGSDGLFETFTVDQDCLHELLTDVFYKKNN